MGVLDGLHKKGQLGENVDVISSVSGGGYAAYWYFSRLLDLYLSVEKRSAGLHNPIRLDDYFADCLPLRYQMTFGEAKPKAYVLPPPCPKPETNFDPVSNVDQYRWQNHLRGFQDVLSNDFNYSSTGDRQALSMDVAKALGLSLATAPGHWFTNVLFDWKLHVSPSRRQYTRGIERTYGLRPVDCSRPLDAALNGGSGATQVCAEFRDGKERSHHERANPNRLADRGYTFAMIDVVRRLAPRMRKEHEQALPKMPFWVVNTTAGVSKSPFDLLESSQPTWEDAVFEFTPNGYGSGVYGYWPGSHPEMDVAAAVAASSAFFDSQQRSLGKQPLRGLAGLGMRLAQLDWGTTIANPSRQDRHRGRHWVLPFPLYYAHGATRNARSPYIRVSDGGQSDNTGIFSLVRRGVTKIVFADGGFDREGKMADLCRVQRELRMSNLRLVLGDEFDAVCQGNQKLDLWNMRSPLLTGCIVFGSTTCDRNNAVYYADLLVLKLSMPTREIHAQIESCAARVMGMESCAPDYLAAESVLPGLPLEVFAFLVKSYQGSPWEKRGNPVFPQHSTVKMTLNSSPWLYGAYRELAAWQVAKHLPSLSDWKR